MTKVPSPGNVTMQVRLLFIYNKLQLFLCNSSVLSLVAKEQNLAHIGIYFVFQITVVDATNHESSTASLSVEVTPGEKR